MGSANDETCNVSPSESNWDLNGWDVGQGEDVGLLILSVDLHDIAERMPVVSFESLELPLVTSSSLRSLFLR